MLNIVFRCDASVQIGSGHIMRCLALANELREQGADVTFVCREHPGHLFDVIESYNFRLLRLSIPVFSTKGSLVHAHWLGGTQEEDSQQTLSVLTTIGKADWLIVDHYALDIVWESAMREIADHIMVIDDLADRGHDCDVLLDQNLQLADFDARYEKLVPNHCKQLLGPKYALLRPEFLQAQTCNKSRVAETLRVFVFFGSSDLTNETVKTLRSIQQLGRTGITTDLVVGYANPYQEEIAEICTHIENIKVHRQVKNMAKMMAGADIAIGAGGITMWERCSLGLPSIVMSVAENQQAGCEAAARQGAIVYLGASASVGEDLLLAAMRVLVAAPAFLQSISLKSAALVDGKGVIRVARQLLGSKMILRRATPSDCESIFHWRDAEETRKFSNTTSRISLQDHRAWYRNVLDNNDQQLLIGELDKQPVGVLRIDRDGKRAVVSVYLVPGNYGKGFGGQIIEQGIAWVKLHWAELVCLEAIIKDENKVSKSVFLEAGFKCSVCTYVNELRTKT